MKFCFFVKIALFGKATIEYIKGGGGSGDVHCPYIRNIFEGFKAKEKEGKTAVYMPLVDFYKDYVEKESVHIPTQDQINATWDIVNAMEFCTKRDDMTYDTFASMHVKEPAVPEELINSAAEWAETAIITISRFSAEGVDRRPQGGDYYLSDIEKDLIDKACKLFKKVVIVINSGATIDCEYFAENNDVDPILFTWHGGLEGGAAIADILTGDVNPSGKLVDTIAKSYDFFPCKDDFWECFDHLDYSDDIYVGYRYFETVPGGKEKVRYPFGFGLSYTSFAVTNKVCLESDGKILAIAEVKNTGDVAGREVVQVYYSAPQGKLGKPSRVLSAYKKTKLLQPGEKETLVMSFDINSMASFDDLGKVQKSAYVLEKGTYSFFIGTDVRNAEKVEFEYKLKEDVVAEQLTSLCKPFKLEKRMLSDGTFENLPTGEESYFYAENKPTGAVAPEKEVMFDKVGEEISIDEFVAQFTLEELMDFVGGHAPTGVANTGCFGGLKRLGVPAVPTADGPAGLRLEPETGIPTTAWPCATLLACTWDPELLYRVGQAAALEVKENNFGMWLTPAINIHRSPLCGRNFEYYSEDPRLTGLMAAAITRGVQQEDGFYVTVKHFACNNQEDNRNYVSSNVSERALREIYLRGFEEAVRGGGAKSIMTSYNRVNGVYSPNSYDLCTKVLRNEWGFDGVVMTDWFSTGGGKGDTALCMASGNDLIMPGGGIFKAEILRGLKAGRIKETDIRRCCANVLKQIFASATQREYIDRCQDSELV